MSFVDLGSRNLWVAAHTRTSPGRGRKLVPVWRLLNPPAAARDLGHANELKPVDPAKLRSALTQSIRAALLAAAAGLAARDVIILEFGAEEPDRSRTGLIAGLTPALRSDKAIATTIRMDEFLLELTLTRNRMLSIQPWVFETTDSSMFEGDLAAMDVTCFDLMRPGIDRVTLDVAKLLPRPWPDLAAPDALAAWLGTLFVDEINPTLPQPFRLGKPPSEITPDEIARARALLGDIMTADPELAGLEACRLYLDLPNGPFGVARFDRREAGFSGAAADRLAVLVGMATEDIAGSPLDLAQSTHPDLMPRRQGGHAGGMLVNRPVAATAHQRMSAHTRVAALYTAKRRAWLMRWREAAPDGLPIPDGTIAELDGLYLDGKAQVA